MKSKMLCVLACVCIISVMHAAPLARHMVDLTYTFDETTLYFPSLKKFNSTTLLYTNITTEDSVIPWIQSEEYSSSTHVGTHMDAPRHFAKGGKTIDQLDIEHFIGPAAVVDITRRAELDPDTTLSVEDLVRWETTTRQTLNATIVLVRTGWGKKWGNRTAFFGIQENNPTQLHFPGISEEAAQWLVDNRNIWGVGIDTLAIDNGPSVDLLAHQILLGSGIFALENVARMEEIPIYGAQLYVMPMKIGGGSGAPTRIIATFPKVVFKSPNVKNHHQKKEV